MFRWVKRSIVGKEAGTVPHEMIQKPSLLGRWVWCAKPMVEKLIVNQPVLLPAVVHHVSSWFARPSARSGKLVPFGGTRPDECVRPRYNEPCHALAILWARWSTKLGFLELYSHVLSP